jgi:pimeloyl-ACP methyl ester carboxylesterase
MPFVEVEEGRLYYDVRGEGRPLTLIHGAWASHAWWRWQVPELARRYRVLSPDVRGHGQSSDLRGAYSLEGFGQDLKVLFRTEGIDEAAIVGWSMGGLISLEFCRQFPSMVKALILIATGSRPRLLMRQYLRSILCLLTDFSAPRKFDRTGKTFRARKKIWVEEEVKKMLSPTAPKEVFHWVVTEVGLHQRENFFEVARSFSKWEAREALKDAIKVPTLIMVGENDRLTPPRLARLIHESIPGSRLVIVEGTGHYLPLERPDVVNSEILRFLNSLGYEMA